MRECRFRRAFSIILLVFQRNCRIRQGCALTAPGRLRRLIFGFGRVRKTTRSPGWALWLIVFLADKAAKNFNMLVVTVYETSQKMFFLRTKYR